MCVLTVFIMYIGQQIEADPTAKTFAASEAWKGKIIQRLLQDMDEETSDQSLWKKHRSLDCFLGFLNPFMDIFPIRLLEIYCIFNLISTSRSVVGAGQAAWHVEQLAQMKASQMALG